MKPVVYVSAKLYRILREMDVEENAKIPENEILIVNTDAAIDAVLDDKQQIASSKACIKFSAVEADIKQFLKGEVDEA